MEWIVQKNGIGDLCNYLNIFFISSGLESSDCPQNLSSLIKWVEWLDFPLAWEKVEWPSTILTFLGVKLDTKALILCLFEEKLVTLKNLIGSWRSC